MHMSVIHLLLNAQILPLILLENYLFHLVNWHCTFHVNPLLLDYVLITKFKHNINRTNVIEGHKAKTSWLLRSLVLQNHCIFNVAKVEKVIFKGAKFKIVR